MYDYYSIINVIFITYTSCNTLWESEFDGIVSKRDKLQDLNINQLKLEVHDTYKKDEKLTTDFEPTDNSDVINKVYLDENLSKINGHLSKLEKDYNEFNLQYNKQNVEDILIQRAVKTTIHTLYDKGLFDNYANADEVEEDFYLQHDVEVTYQKIIHNYIYNTRILTNIWVPIQ